MSRYAWRDDVPDAQDLALLETELRAATIDPHQPPQPCRTDLPPGLLCPNFCDDHPTTNEDERNVA